MSGMYWEQEEQIIKALNALRNEGYSSVRAAALAFGITPRTLLRRSKGSASKSTRPPTGRTLTEEQERALCEYIERLDRCELSAKLPMVEKAANYLLCQAHCDPQIPPPMVGSTWVSRFLARHPQYFKRKQKPLAADRKHAHNLDDMQRHFEKFQIAKEDLGVTDEDTWNMDETGFRIGCGKTHWVISTYAKKPLLLMDPDNRDYVTSIETISGGGRNIPSIVILAGVNILEKWVKNNLPDDIGFATSPTGYSNDDIALAWLKHFDHHSKKSQLGVWRLLVIDGFGSHLSYEFYHYAQAHKIELFQLPPHSTHLTQPLDVGCFQPFKHHHAEGLDETVRDGGVDFDKLDFLAMFRRMHEKTFTRSTILSAWQKTGLIPYNPGVIIRKIQAIQNSRPVTPLSIYSATRLLACTPCGPKELVDYGENLQRSMSKYHVVLLSINFI